MTIPAPIIALSLFAVPLILLGIYSLILDYREAEDDPPADQVPKH